MNQYSFVFVAIITTAILSSGSIVSNGFSSSSASASISYCPPICLDEVQEHVNDAREALDEGKILEAASELDIVNSLLDQIDDMTSQSD